MTSTKYTFKKEERITATKDIDWLFNAGQSFKSFPLRVLYITKSPCSPTTKSAVLISVPKKRFKRAVKRNKIKRLIRESYRLNKNTLIESLTITTGMELLIAFIYIGENVCSFMEISDAMKKALSIIKDKLLCTDV